MISKTFSPCFLILQMIISFPRPPGLIHYTLQESLMAGFSCEGCNSALQDFLPFMASWTNWWQLLSFSLLPHPTKRADPESYQHSSLCRPTLPYFHCFPWTWSDWQGLGGCYIWGPLRRAVINLRNHRFLLETHACEARAKLASQRAPQSLFALCQWHQPLPLTACSAVLKQWLGMACGNGFKLIAPLQKMWNHFFRLPAVTALWLGGHRYVVMSGQHFPRVLNVFKIFNVSIWIFLGGLIVQI